MKECKKCANELDMRVLKEDEVEIFYGFCDECKIVLICDILVNGKKLEERV